MAERIMTQVPRTVLVVEDNPMTLKMLRIALESEGYSVIEARDGRSAIAAAERAMPALVLQDLILPDMSGFELVRQLRALPGGAETPILALSGFLNRIEEARTGQSDFTALLVKPVEPARLLETVAAYLPARHRERDRSADGRKLLVIDDDPVQLKLAKLHLEQLGFDVTGATSSVEALRYARVHRPDIVFVDLLMPDLDGFQLCFEMRRDPKLADVPVVLSSAWYPSEGDTELARRVGANALVLRTPELRGVGDALLQALREGAPTETQALTTEVQLEHARAAIRQLERQITMSADLARRCTLQAAQISLLGGIADALARQGDSTAALRDVLAATLDAADMSKGALFLRDPSGALVLRHAIGFSPSEQAHGAATFFGQMALLEEAIERQATLSIPSSGVPEATGRTILTKADIASAQIVPLVSEGRGVGAMLLAARRTDVNSEDSIAFARAIGNQLAQSIDLSASFARLAASELRYRTVTESANDAISILTPEGVIIDANRSFERMLGLARNQIVGHSLGDFTAPGHERDHVESYGRSLTSNAPTAPRPLRKADGSVVLVEFSNRSVDVAGEKLVFSIGRDVTERVQAQAHLMVSDRMASIGTLAAGVAHEINNPLAAATANLDFVSKAVAELAQRFGPPEFAEIQEALRDAREAADRVRIIVRDLKIFSRPEDERRGPIDVQRVLESSLRMAWNEIRHRVHLVKEYEAVRPVLASESRLGQVFLNLIVNAAQAMPEGQANVNQIRVRTRSDGPDRVSVEIEDTGPGIAPDVMQRLFTPFFTTKPAGVGSGLGLSICQRIVTDLGGHIEVDTEMGRGTVFRVLLPAALEEELPRTSEPPPARIAPRRGRILVVDDEPTIGTAVRRMLGSDHDVVTMTSAEKALDLIIAGERFDVVVCDLMMPVMTGIEFYGQLSAKSPEHAQRVLFLSGGAFTVEAREFLDRVPNARLEKPFEVQTLRALVNERLR
jgi:PAS domain S-box-containing protein